MSERQYYYMFEILKLEAVVKRVEVEKSGESAPRCTLSQKEIKEYTPFRTIYKDRPEKLEEVVRETIDLRPNERKKVLDKLKIQPDRDVKEVKNLPN